MKQDMVKNNYVGIRKYIPYSLKKQIWKIRYRGKVISSIMQWYESKPLFDLVQIETLNRCNGECSFCPVNRFVESRKYAKMSYELFRKIIDELSELKYSGHLALFSNNEPFLDVRLADFAKYAREKLPCTYIYIYTNGTIINIEKIQEIIPYLNRILIDNYNDNLDINDNLIDIYHEMSRNPEWDDKIELVLRKQHEVMSSRGGDSPNKKLKRSYNMPCLKPYRQVIIRPDGKISLCCNDALGHMTLGDVNKDNITDIWYGKAFSEYRDKLKKNRKQVDMCRFCDAFDSYEI